MPSKRDTLMADLATAGFAVGSVSDRTHSLLRSVEVYQASINDYIVNEGGLAPVTTKNSMQ